MNPLYEAMATSVFERMSLLAAKYDAVNLGQGFPDFGWADEVLDAAAKAVITGSNQYAPSRGLPALREAVAAHYRRHFGVNHAASEVCVTSGATEALGAAILASVTPGDEVIILAPAYDCYAPMIRRAGGVVREVALKPGRAMNGPRLPRFRRHAERRRPGIRRIRPCRARHGHRPQDSTGAEHRCAS